ncbi:MAG: redox-sensitive bicupin YhaK (pirin superfamily) [Paraglaciecola sp.]
MIKNRQITQVVSGQNTSDGGGVKLKRIIGQGALPRLDPFLMLDEFGSDQPEDYLAGFPEHPHRGFQTVTYMLAGKMQHTDSRGNVGMIESGGLQWMNAGKGIIHAEMPQQSEGLMRGFQLWINLPATHKMSDPSYQDIPQADIPVLEVNSGLHVKVLAGTYGDISGPVNTQAVKPLFVDILFHSTQTTAVPLEQGSTAFVYCYQGSVHIGEHQLVQGQLGVLSDGEQVELVGQPDARCILVSGQPINEPIVQYGPFVMNTQQEIDQALQDYRSGKLA